MTLLFEHFGKWETDKTILTQLAWFLITYHCCLRGSEIQRYLTRNGLQVCRDEDGAEYFRLATSDVSKNHQAGISGSDPVSDVWHIILLSFSNYNVALGLKKV